MERIKALGLLAGVAVLSACSPYVYNQEITSFGTGVTAVVSSYQTGVQSVDATLLQQQLAADATARTRLMLLPGCNQMDPNGTPPKLPDCAVVAFGATGAPAPNAVQAALADAAPAFNALKVYATALTAVTNATDAATLKTATQGLTTAASGLAGAAAKVDTSLKPAASLVTAGGGLAGQGVSIYLDQRRYAALKDTVPTMEPFVATLGRTVRAALLEIREQQLLALGPDLRNAALPLETVSVGSMAQSDYQGKLAALETKVAAFNLARAADPTATVTAMVTAHHDLATALQTNAGQGMAVLTSTESFVTAAEGLQTAITAASAAAATPAPASSKAASGGAKAAPAGAKAAPAAKK
jgi:hypothetical protein